MGDNWVNTMIIDDSLRAALPGVNKIDVERVCSPLKREMRFMILSMEWNLPVVLKLLLDSKSIISY